jgi:hypothetical protein
MMWFAPIGSGVAVHKPIESHKRDTLHSARSLFIALPMFASNGDIRAMMHGGTAGSGIRTVVHLGALLLLKLTRGCRVH